MLRLLSKCHQRSLLSIDKPRVNQYIANTIMATVSRFGVSLEQDLLAIFDRNILKEGYANRSEAIRDLIRDRISNSHEEIVGVVTLLYDHRTHRLSDLLADMQHRAEVNVHASLHVHLDEHKCLEVIVIQGDSQRVHGVTGRLIATKGVENGKLVTTVA